MFGEEEIIGIKNLRINKNRITLPSFTFATPDDELFFIFDRTKGHMILAQEQKIMETLGKIRLDLQEKVRNGEISFRDYLKCQRYLYGIMCIEGHKVDAQRRILLPERGLKQLNISKDVTVIGRGTKLDIYPYSEELSKGMSF